MPTLCSATVRGKHLSSQQGQARVRIKVTVEFTLKFTLKLTLKYTLKWWFMGVYLIRIL